MFGMGYDDADGVDETFNISGRINGGTAHPSFFVGTAFIAAGTCPATDIFQQGSDVDDDFVEVLLTDNSSIIFTTIIENDATGNSTDPLGYKTSANASYDFQMLVGDDGHDGDTNSRTYYFFIELS